MPGAPALPVFALQTQDLAPRAPWGSQVREVMQATTPRAGSTAGRSPNPRGQLRGSGGAHVPKDVCGMSVGARTARCCPRAWREPRARHAPALCVSCGCRAEHPARAAPSSTGRSAGRVLPPGLRPSSRGSPRLSSASRGAPRLLPVSGSSPLCAHPSKSTCQTTNYTQQGAHPTAVRPCVM